MSSLSARDGKTNGAPFFVQPAPYRSVRPFPHGRRPTRRTVPVLALALLGMLATPYVVGAVLTVLEPRPASVSDLPDIDDTALSLPGTRDIAGNQRHWLRTTSHATETACTTNQVASTTQGPGPASQRTLGVGGDACWYADATTGTTIPAGSWESLLDVTTAQTANQLFMIFPNANGNYNQMAPTGCAIGSEWQCVDEDPNDGDTTYLLGDVDADKTSPNLQDVTFTATPADVDVCVQTWWRKIAAQAASARGMLRSGTTDAFGTAFNPPNSATYATAPELCRDTDPADGLDWTQADINALQAGGEAVDAAPDVRISEVKVTVWVNYSAAVEYDVYLQIWNKDTDTVTETIGSCLDVTTTGDDVQCLVSGVAAKTIAANEVVRIRVAHSFGSGTVTIDYNDADATGDSRITTPIPEFPIPIAVAAAVAILLAKQRRQR